VVTIPISIIITPNNHTNYNRGFKSFAAAEAGTGYIFAFHPYQGRDEKRPEGQSLGTFAVMQVLSSAFDQMGYIVTMDNWFMSFSLLQNLNSRGIAALGTVRLGRVGCPSKSMSRLADDSKRGDFCVWKRRDADMYAWVWEDKKDVRLLSTFPGPVGSCFRKMKANKDTPFQLVELPQPALIGYYNQTMGGVDLNDQSTSYFRILIRCRRPLRNYLFHLLQLAGHNTWVIHQKSNSDLYATEEPGIKPFIGALALQLIKPFLSEQAAKLKKRPASWQTMKKLRRDESIFSGLHVPDCVPAKDKGSGKDNRRSCRVCTSLGIKANVTTFCRQCNVFLCLGDHWATWHTQDSECI